jgi:protease IV
MDDTGQSGPGYPPSYPPSGPPSAEYPPVYQTATVPEPLPARRGRGWLVALGVVVLLVFGAIAMCGWFGTLVSGLGTSALKGDAVALIHINGVIAGTSGSLSGGSVTPEAILDQLQQAEDDKQVKAILLRVDSPGGTVAASEEIATEVGRVSKPVVVSIGDVGASGAYMVSSQADWIVATPGSDVGSIGVILEVANLQTLLDKLGVKFAVITAGEFKGIGSPYRSLTATETKMLQEQVDLAYEQFIDIVAKGRRMPVDEVRKLATGMAWAGTQAKTYGLVDQIGTYNDALDKAARLGKIDGTPDVVEYGRTPYGDLLNSLLGISSKLGTIGEALSSGTTGGSATTRPLTR